MESQSVAEVSELIALPSSPKHLLIHVFSFIKFTFVSIEGVYTSPRVLFNKLYATVKTYWGRPLSFGKVGVTKELFLTPWCYIGSITYSFFITSLSTE